MEGAVEVLIVCSVPTTAAGVQAALAGGPREVRCRTVPAADRDAGVGHAKPDVVIVAPQDWREMSGWLPALQWRFGACRWLVLAPLRVAGMFAWFLEGRLCTIVSPLSPREDLATAFWSLVEGIALLEPKSLPVRFAEGLPHLPSTRHPLPLSDRELQCGCAVSLGLRNRQIAAALSISEGTVKNHIHELLRKCHREDRVKLAAFIAEALPH